MLTFRQALPSWSVEPSAEHSDALRTAIQRSPNFVTSEVTNQPTEIDARRSGTEYVDDLTPEINEEPLR